MNLQTIVAQLRLIFADPRAAADAFRAEPPASALTLAARKHSILLLLFPVFSFAAPLRWIMGGDFRAARDAVLPLGLACGILVLAMLFDKIIENARGPELYVRDAPPRNLALFLHLPVSAAGVFFLFHGLAGFLMILVSAAYAGTLSILAVSRLRAMSPARAITHYVTAVVFLLVPLLGLVLILNLLRTYAILKFLYW